MGTVADPMTKADRVAVVEDWLSRLRSGLTGQEPEAIERCFAPAGSYRDLLASSWDLRNFQGAEQIGRALGTSERAAEISSLKIRPDEAPQLVDDPDGAQLLAFVEFTNRIGRGDGFVRLALQSSGNWAAIALVLELVELDRYPWATNGNRPIGKAHGPVARRVPWADVYDHEFDRDEPQVVVVGAGHNGLAIAARLGRLGVSTLVVERHERVGDNWRHRYPSLALHDPVGADHLPYLPLPSTWPEYTPTEKFGEFLDCYATLMDISVWAGTTIESILKDEESGWVIELKRADGSKRTVRPNHVIMATGANDAPKMPELVGVDEFPGTVVHSTAFKGGADWTGKRAVVIGAGVSGHDIAQDLWEQGAEVTMVQRGPIWVINASTFHQLFWASWLPGGPPTEDADLMAALFPFGAYPSFGPAVVQAAAKTDRELHVGLENAGFRLGWGPNGEGVHGLTFRENRTGFYYNIGASDLIVDGSIPVVQGEFECLTSRGVRLQDQTELDADLVVFATGFHSVRDSIRPLLGELIDQLPEDLCKVGPDGEFSATWRNSGVDGLWFMTSPGIFFARFYSSHLALHIKAIEEGLAPLGKDTWEPLSEATEASR